MTAELPYRRIRDLPRGFLHEADRLEGCLYLCPIAGSARSPDFCEVLIRNPDRIEVVAASVAEVDAWAREEGRDVGTHVATIVDRWRNPPSSFAGLTLGDAIGRTPLVMGIVNVTPDSFSDGGETLAPGDAVARGLELRDAGADIVDVGGESTRPGADPVDPAVEAARVVPVIRALAAAGVAVSIDTRHAAVMAAALAAGAAIVNDVSALDGDPESLGVIAAAGCPVVLMHMWGEPKTMNADPVYGSASLDVYDYLAARVAAATQAGIAREAIAVDPGLGFGKTAAHNREILARLGIFQGLGCPILIGASRKFGRRDEAPKDRLAASLAAGLMAVGEGAGILRVHDVAETRRALDVWTSITKAGRY